MWCAIKTFLFGNKSEKARAKDNSGMPIKNRASKDKVLDQYSIGGVTITTSVGYAEADNEIVLIPSSDECFEGEAPSGDLWLHWPEQLHKTPIQRTRLSNMSDYNIVLYSPRYQVAKLNRFIVTPLECECADFKKRNAPCSHMYFLMSCLYNDPRFYQTFYPLKDSWGEWDSRIHFLYEQKKRQGPRMLEFNVDFIDHSSQTGKMSFCQTSLKNCSCMDFRKRQLPCKHIYRLAYELGVHTPVKND